MQRISKTIFLAGLISLTSTFSSVSAQSTDWQGVYAQVGTGYQMYATGTTSGDLGSLGVYEDNRFNSASFTNNSAALNLAAGYNFALTPSFVLGLGIDYNPLSTSYSKSSVYYPSINRSFDNKWRALNTYSIFFSPGWAIDNTKLVYAKVGYAASQRQTTVMTYNFAGYSLGLGYRQFIHKKIYAFGEINYADYGNHALRPGVTGTQNLTSFNALLGIGYQF
jgi:hypothetical protein